MSRRTRFRNWFTLVAVVTLSAACHGDRAKVLESRVEQIHEFVLNGELTVRNGDGSIRIYCSDKPGMTLYAIKKAYSKERLDGIEIKVSAAPASIAIDTIFPPKKEGWSLGDRSGTVDYVIVVPHSARIRKLELVNGEVAIEGLRGGTAQARLVNGRMYARNCFGHLDFEVTNGGLDIYYDWWEARTFAIEASISRGRIVAAMPTGASFRAEAQTSDGKIMNDFSPNAPANEKHLNLTVGAAPAPTFRLRAIRGNIRFARAY